MKTCKRCRETLPLEDFAADTHGRDGRRTICRACDAARLRERYANNAEAIKEQRRWTYHADRETERAKGRERDRRRAARLRAEREAEREYVASVFDRSQKGQRYRLTIEVNRRRLAVMDRTGVDVVREGLLRFEFTRQTCEATIRALEAERRDIIGRLLRLRLAAKKHNERVAPEELRRAA